MAENSNNMSTHKFPKPPMFPVPPPGMERFSAPRHGMIQPPIRPPVAVSSPNIPPDLGPPNGRLPGIRAPDLRAPPLRPPASFPNFPPGFSNNVQAPFRPSFPPQQPRVPLTPPPMNTTLPKPPIFDKDGEPWLEACSATGKVYYFNARSRETRWDKPESFESAEEKKEAKKDVVEENNTGESAVSDDEMKLSDTEMKLSDSEMKVSDNEMKLSDNEMKLSDTESKVLDTEMKLSSDTDMKLSDSEMNLSDTEMKEDDDQIGFTQDISDAPLRPSVSAEKISEMKTVQSLHLPTDDTPFMQQQTLRHDAQMQGESQKEMPTLHFQQEQISQEKPPQMSTQTPKEVHTESMAQQPIAQTNMHQMPVLIHREISQEDYMPPQLHEQQQKQDSHPQHVLKQETTLVEEPLSSDEDLPVDKTIKEDPNAQQDYEKRLQVPIQMEQQDTPIREGSPKQPENSKQALLPQPLEGRGVLSKEDEIQKQDSKVEPQRDVSCHQEPVAVSQKSSSSLQRPPFPTQTMPPGLPLPFELSTLMRPPPGMPPPGFPGFPPRMPHGMVPSRFPPFPGFRLPVLDFVPRTIGDWTEHRLPDGRLYYYNNKTKESKWEKPPEFLAPPKTEASEKKDIAEKVEMEIGDKKKEENNEKEKETECKDEKSEETVEESDPRKPVASRPIVGTGWHLVWTGDGKVFFFNPTSKTSIWERPKELEDNENVDEILKLGPKGTVPKPEPEKEEPAPEPAPAPVVVKPEVEEKVVKVEDVEPEPKKKKMNPKPDDISALPIVAGTDESLNGIQKVQSEEVREVEVRKAIIPLDERMTMFTNLLKEKEVSAFSTWEKELHKILFDPRYLLLTMKERKHCFERYVKVRAVEERKERIQKLREKKEDFKRLLEEVISSARISFSDFAGKNSKDIRFKAVEKMKDREALFNEYMIDFRKHEKEKLKIREERLRKQFFELLGELNNLNETSQWKKVKSSIEVDRRYELVGSSAKREQFFYEFIREIEEKKNVEPISPGSPAPPPPMDDMEEPVRPPSPDGDPDSLDKSERIAASMRKREQEVRAQKEIYEKDREKERGIHMHEKAVQHFMALLADMVKDTQYTWKETRRSLRKDPRWSAVDVLDKEEKEELFNEHIDEIREKRRKAFRRLLDDTDVPLDAHWREVRRKVKEDPRYIKFGNSEMREDEFEHYLREKVTAARSEFRELLRETKLVTYRSKRMADENPNHIRDIHAVLKKDKRYLTMSSLSNEREKLIHSHIDDLHRRGPPPPPTATNPSARHKKD